MYAYYFTFHSVTTAQSALSELLRKGLSAELIRTPKKLSSSGCGYAVKVSSGDGYSASAALKATGVFPIKSLRVFSDGRIEVAGL